jgi:acyl-coenzyme A synthetase/AMP-(fatty) acid ligase
VSLQDGAALDETAVRIHCAEYLEDFKVPRSVFVHADLPRTSNGKIDRRALAERTP